MGLIHSLLFGGMLAGSAIKAASENIDAKKNSLTMPNGVKIYYDRLGVMRLMDGTRIEKRNNAFYNSVTGRLVYSAENERIAKANMETSTALNEGTAQGYKYIMVKDPKFTCPMCLEVETNKYVARLVENLYRGENGLFTSYYKYYWDSEHKYTAPGCNLYDGSFLDVRSQVKITKEEHDAIKNAYMPDKTFRYHWKFLSYNDYTDWGIVKQVPIEK